MKKKNRSVVSTGLLRATAGIDLLSKSYLLRGRLYQEMERRNGIRKITKKRREGWEMTKSQAGSIGGKATVKKYGRSYMSTLAKKGAQAFHAKYKLQKLGTSDFAIVHRGTGIPTGKTINGDVIRGWRP